MIPQQDYYMLEAHKLSDMSSTGEDSTPALAPGLGPALAPGLGPAFCGVPHSRNVRLPVIRIFGCTTAGQKACVHVHGVSITQRHVFTCIDALCMQAFPYFYIRPSNEEEALTWEQLSTVHSMLPAIERGIEEAVAALDAQRQSAGAEKNDPMRRRRVKKLVQQVLAWFRAYVSFDEFLTAYGSATRPNVRLSFRICKLRSCQLVRSTNADESSNSSAEWNGCAHTVPDV
jgi:hypothetical protein